MKKESLKAQRERAGKIREALEKEYPEAGCELASWTTPFELAVATILSAQCTDKRVNMVTPGLFKKYPTVAAFAAAGLEELERALDKLLGAEEPLNAGEILTNERQYDAIFRAETAVRRASEALRAGFTPDAVLTDAEEALAALGEVSGRTLREDLVEAVFSRFCVGK